MTTRGRPATGQPALRASALWVVALAAMLYFPTLGPTLGLGVTDSFRFALLADMWWLIAVLLMAAVGLLLRKQSMLDWRTTVLIQAGCLLIGWITVKPWASAWQVGAAWLHTGAWLPAAILVVGCLSYLVNDRRRFALERSAAETELCVLAAQTRALVAAHARIIEEARSQSRNVAAAVRAAMRMAQDDEMHNRDLRALLDADVRASAREASHRVHELSPGAPDAATPARRRSFGQWLDALSTESSWHVLAGYAIAGAAVAPGILITHGWVSGIVISACSFVIALLVAGGISAVTHRPRDLSRVARRALLVMAFWLGAIALIAPSVFTTVSVVPRDAWITVLLTAPALACIAALPLAVAAGGERRSAMRAELRAQLSLATARRDAAASELESARQAVVATLHTHVQGRAAAALTAMDLAEAGVPGTHEILDAVLQELADLDIDVSTGKAIGSADPITAVLDSWHGILSITVLENDLTASPMQFTIARHLQDMLLNAVLHGHARAVSVSLTRDTDRARLSVIDDGIGPRRGYAAGLGLGGVVEAGGTWQLTRMDGNTHAVVSIPLPVRTAPDHTPAEVTP